MLQALVIAAAAATVAAQSSCPSSYQCEYFFETCKELYYWNFAKLCRSTGWYYFDQSNPGWGHLYFNVCGNSPKLCNPQGMTTVYQYGVAVQASNATAPAGNCGSLPCTADCEVLGVGQPIFLPRDPSNPQTGGINISHTNVLEFDSDKYECNYVPELGTYRSRAINYIMDCDPKEEGLVVTKSVEDPQCTYNLFIRTKYACGRIYDASQSEGA